MAPRSHGGPHGLGHLHAISGIKRSRCVKDVLRNTHPDSSDGFIESATGLHNIRVLHRKRHLRR